MKIGDRVKIVCGSVPRKGQSGTIVGVTGTESPLHWFVDFGKSDDVPELANGDFVPLSSLISSPAVGLYRGDEFVLLEGEGRD